MPQIEFDEESHKYTVDGKNVPSVTTILNYITADHYNSIAPAILDRAKARGTAVHEALEMFDYGGDMEGYTEIVPYLTAYIDFMSTYKVEWLAIEKMVYNAEKNYIGTVDRFGLVDGKYAVLDLKTTSSPTKGAYLSVACQTYLYALALGMPDAKRYALYLKSDGDYRLMDLCDWERKNCVDVEKISFGCLKLYTEIHEILDKKGRKK